MFMEGKSRKLLQRLRSIEINPSVRGALLEGAMMLKVFGYPKMLLIARDFEGFG